MGHVEWSVDLRNISATDTGGRLIAVVEKADLVNLVQLPCLTGNIGGRKVQPSKEILGAGVVDLLSDDAAVPGFVELVDHDAVELLWALEKGQQRKRDMEESRGQRDKGRKRSKRRKRRKRRKGRKGRSRIRTVSSRKTPAVTCEGKRTS